MGLTLAQVLPRLGGEVKEGLLKLVDTAVSAGWPHTRACWTPGVSDVQVHRWRARLFDVREWPHLTCIDDPAVLDTELGRIGAEYNTVRLHQSGM